MQRMLNEKQWRQYLAREARVHGNILQTARLAGMSRNTIRHAGLVNVGIDHHTVAFAVETIRRW